ncbi:transport system permease protein [Desulfarculus baarsii DSM 2075]|uniref:Transport system permease protein n=1 Tax=Desulfarculus baarsii (strain ATCC 33931 / DSM 2075 / LMG 7858 / VKM B-1802 / 2st14) TaxID=644282 RepID=E1QDQ1_DESB2|nr:iron ABC transporter permease [Desulfarculus baarsii]ADK83687.1 transport system permease protein [Desulfarculus baarsii DSM 2075]
MAGMGRGGPDRDNLTQTISRPWPMLAGLAAALVVLAAFAASHGSYALSPGQFWQALWGDGPPRLGVVLWQIRLPRIAAAIVCGWGLGLAGLALQTLLHNPLASPFTLGFSHAAAFGAALAIVCLDAGDQLVTATRSAAPAEMFLQGPLTISLGAFLATIAASAIILALARQKAMSPGAVVLVGVALSSLFAAGTVLVQYLATDSEIAAVVFWSFGDVARSSWREIGLTLAPTALATAYLAANGWAMNALLAGEETAAGLGVNGPRLRFWGMTLAALIIALATAFNGVIGFLGLLAPHVSRMLVGDNHALLLPFSCLTGALLLLLADTMGRLLLVSGAMPVGVLTSFLGAPLFLYLLIKRQDD